MLQLMNTLYLPPVFPCLPPSFPPSFPFSSFPYTIHSFHHYFLPSLLPSFPSLPFSLHHLLPPSLPPSHPLASLFNTLCTVHSPLFPSCVPTGWCYSNLCGFKGMSYYHSSALNCKRRQCKHFYEGMISYVPHSFPSLLPTSLLFCLTHYRLLFLLLLPSLPPSLPPSLSPLYFPLFLLCTLPYALMCTYRMVLQLLWFHHKMVIGK